MRKRHGWGLAQSLRYVALLVPELFAGMHPDTPRKWKLRVARGRGVPPGRPRACQLTSWLTWHRLLVHLHSGANIFARHGSRVRGAAESAGAPSDGRAQLSRISVQAWSDLPAQVYNDEDIHSGGSGRSSEERVGKTHFNMNFHDIDNFIVGRISRHRHEQRDAGQAMGSAHGLAPQSTSVRSTERRCRSSGLT